jgi:hypothetical protein
MVWNLRRRNQEDVRAFRISGAIGRRKMQEKRLSWQHSDHARPGWTMRSRLGREVDQRGNGVLLRWYIYSRIDEYTGGDSENAALQIVVGCWAAFPNANSKLAVVWVQEKGRRFVVIAF